MRVSVRSLFLALVVLCVATTVSATPNIAVLRDWDNVVVPNGGTFAFSPVAAGVSDSRLFRIANTGNTSLTLTNPDTMVSGQCFHEIVTPTTPILAGGVSYVRVRILCNAPGSYSGTVTVASDDPDTPSYRFTVTGTVLPPPAGDIAVIRDWDGTPMANGGTFVFPDPVVVGATQSRRFRIDNTGNANLNLTNPAAIVSGTCFHQIEDPVTPILPGGSSWVRVRFQCASAGTFQGTVSIASDDPDENPYQFAVAGTAVPAPPPDIAVATDGDNIPIANGGVFSFPATVFVGSPQSRRFRIDNTGGSDLHLTNATSTVSGTCFFQIEDPAAVVPPATSTYVRVRFQ
ncbi:MAG TPA: choice-of-anchor D domain-containing protein, partial [Thermoanaerobaculia bacterium]|nr:choice-of-anchor D domain-containing protein [Thermoanaerobaculia bacterium]